MDTEEEIHFESTSLDYAQQLADIQEDLLGIEPDQIDDYVTDIIESPLMEKENRINYLTNAFVQTAKNRPKNIENLALLTRRLVDKLYETSDEKGNLFFTSLLSHLRNPFDLGDSGCFFYRQLIVNEVMSIADIFNEIDSIEINQKIVDKVSFEPKKNLRFDWQRQQQRKQQVGLEEEDENYELYKVFGYIDSSSCLLVDKVETTEQILIKSGLMRWLADYFYTEFPGTVSQYLKSFEISFPYQIDEYRKEANEGMNNNNLCVIIRNDDIDTFKQIAVNTINFDLNQKIKRYKFERNPEMNKTTLIEYAIYYNSMKIFKYLFLNIEKDDLLNKNPNIEQKAIIGNNIECVRLLDQSNFITKESLFYSIKSFETDIFIWLYQNKYPNGYFKKSSNKSITSQIFDYCIKYGNMQILLFLLVDEDFDINFKDTNGNTLLYTCAKYDKRLIARFLMLNDKFKMTISNFLQIIYASIEFNHPKIFSSFLKVNGSLIQPYYSSILSCIYKNNSTECFEAAIKIIPQNAIRRDFYLVDFLITNYTSEMIYRFLKEFPKSSLFYNLDVLKQLYKRNDCQTFIFIIDKAFHNRETVLKFSINIENLISRKDTLLEVLKGFDIPHYYIADKIQKDSFELMIGEITGNVCVQFFRNQKPKLPELKI